MHPDHFEGFPAEQSANTESLKALHGFIASLSSAAMTQPAELVFHTRAKAEPGATSFQRVEVTLTHSLVPLYEAFAVITPDEAKKLRKSEGARGAVQDVNFLDWLDGTIRVRLLASPRANSPKNQSHWRSLLRICGCVGLFCMRRSVRAPSMNVLPSYLACKHRLGSLPRGPRPLPPGAHLSFLVHFLQLLPPARLKPAAVEAAAPGVFRFDAWSRWPTRGPLPVLAPFQTRPAVPCPACIYMLVGPTCLWRPISCV